MTKLTFVLLLLSLTAMVSCRRFRAAGKDDGKAPETVFNDGVQVADDLVLRDAARGRDVPLKIYYPPATAMGGGQMPVILFSHGSGASKEQYEYLGRHWAAQGYVSVHLTHFGSDLSVIKDKPRLSAMSELREASNDTLNIHARPRDISFVIDSFDEIEKRVPALKGKLSRSQIGVAGHSFGSNTTLLVAGARLYEPDGVKTFSDARVKAFVALSPQGTGRLGITKDSWQPIAAPVLLMTGTEDKGMDGGEDYLWRLESYNGLSAGNKYLVVIAGATHLTFAGQAPKRSGASIDPAHLAYITRITTEFWSLYLEPQPDAKTFFTPSAFAAFSNGQATLQMK
ncbi:MAG: acetylhydrolase [Rhizobacter sp.]|nr:acetylhydrolase [Chlorobiales bacterium]